MNLNTNQVKDFFDTPFYLEHGRPVIQARSMIIHDFIGDINNIKILDIGCGDGSLSIPLLKNATSLTLVDISNKMLELASKNIPSDFVNKVHIINATISEFNPSSTYDVVICIGVLAHVPNIQDTIKKISGYLKPTGVAIIEFTPNPNPLDKVLFPYYWLRRKLSGNPMGYSTNKIPLTEILHIAQSSNLTLLKLKRHFFPLPTIAMWPTRWLHTYALFTVRSYLFSKIGTEHIMLFSKEA